MRCVGHGRLGVLQPQPIQRHTALGLLALGELLGGTKQADERQLALRGPFKGLFGILRYALGWRGQLAGRAWGYFPKQISNAWSTLASAVWLGA